MDLTFALYAFHNTSRVVSQPRDSHTVRSFSSTTSIFNVRKSDSDHMTGYE